MFLGVLRIENVDGPEELETLLAAAAAVNYFFAIIRKFRKHFLWFLKARHTQARGGFNLGVGRQQQQQQGLSSRRYGASLSLSPVSPLLRNLIESICIGICLVLSRHVHAAQHAQHAEVKIECDTSSLSSLNCHCLCFSAVSRETNESFAQHSRTMLAMKKFGCVNVMLHRHQHNEAR